MVVKLDDFDMEGVCVADLGFSFVSWVLRQTHDFQMDFGGRPMSFYLNFYSGPRIFMYVLKADPDPWLTPK